MLNYYSILEVEDFASAEVIKKAHRKLSLLYHPDRNNNDKLCEEKFKAIQNAYEELSDPYKKLVHDELLRAYYNPGENNAYAHYQFTQQQPQEPVFVRKKNRSYFPWGLIVVVAGWIIRSLNSTDDTPIYNYNDVKVVYQNSVSDTTQSAGSLALFSALNPGNDTNNTTNTRVQDTGNYFTIGSSMEEVAAMQGYPNTSEPNSYMEATWRYGKSFVHFEGNIVNSYSNTDKNLHVQMPTSSLKKTNADSSFSRGSTKDDVLFAEGTPTTVDEDDMLHEEIWYYASGSVMFQHNIVVSYINNGGMHVK